MAPNTDIATRVLVVALKSPFRGKMTPEIVEKTVIQRGFDPNHIPLVIKDEYLQDAPRSGRPTKQTEDVK
ncbi:hypothetical protein K469DRAFT_716165 [Zopfia rhizophila CBS 207.26]|uniref:Uncharacterized protein n=1 Tax=Zopfia rhizophila CBS 207.26 TaxID=1314779 RepID=A0A6A6DN40_9PEZI|nr:hypothetical protein K469DRAFT_716165 [Zopfia rhizophila CBS 207.26]